MSILIMEETLTIGKSRVLPRISVKCYNVRTEGSSLTTRPRRYQHWLSVPADYLWPKLFTNSKKSFPESLLGFIYQEMNSVYFISRRRRVNVANNSVLVTGLKIEFHAERDYGSGCCADFRMAYMATN